MIKVILGIQFLKDIINGIFQDWICEMEDLNQITHLKEYFQNLLKEQMNMWKID